MNDRALLAAAIHADLLAFTVQTFHAVSAGSVYKHNWHVEAVTHHLNECAAGRIRRLIITQPPRSLKSISVSVAYVAWMLGHDPSLRFICVSYSNELAGDLARQFRAVIDSDWYRRLFPLMQAAKETGLELVTTKGGGRLATSIGGTLTGRGADIIIIDDPLKAEDALSEVGRKRVNEWYRQTLVSRLNDKTTGCIIMVMQRLHEEDLAGYLLEQGGWAHLDLPAIALERQEVPIAPGEVFVREEGDLLHPVHEPSDVLAQIKREIGSFNFSAQYLQRPVPFEGNMIKWAWLRTYRNSPAHNADGEIVQSWDTALKAGNENDYSVCTTWLRRGMDYYLLNVLRQRLEFPDLRRRIVEMHHRFAARWVLIEDKGSGTTLIQDLRCEKTGVRPIGIAPEGDKVTRMSTHTPSLEAGQVFIPESASWLDDFKAEMLAFPHGRYDDQVDSVSQFLKWAKDQQRWATGSGRHVGMW